MLKLGIASYKLQVLDIILLVTEATLETIFSKLLFTLFEETNRENVLSELHTVRYL